MEIGGRGVGLLPGWWKREEIPEGRPPRPRVLMSPLGRFGLNKGG